MSLVLQKNGDRGTSPPLVKYGKEHLIQDFQLHGGNWVVFAKLNIIHTRPAANKVSVTCELHVGTQVDIYEMLDIPGQAMRLASLIVGANLTAQTEARIVYRVPAVGHAGKEPPPVTINIINLTIAAIQVADLTLEQIEQGYSPVGKPTGSAKRIMT
jgi:hypothetical protein